MTERTAIKSITKGTLYSVIISLMLVLVFALILNLTNLSSGVIKPVTQIIKVLSVFIGVAIALRGVQKRGWLYGSIVGLLYTVFAFFIFSILDNNFAITVGLLNDMLFAAVIGVISAFVVRFAKGAAN